jgi:hypothetical membrane protein
VIAGARAKGYSPIEDAISLLAATDASTRWLMTAGFVCFGVAVPAFAFELRRALRGPAWLAALGAGLSTLGVAASPLHVSVTVDRLHGTFATIGYIALALVPFLAARSLWRGHHRRAAVVSWIVSGVSVACLAATPVAEANGLFQRLGLSVVDAWLVANAVALLLTGEVDVGVDAVGKDVGVE